MKTFLRHVFLILLGILAFSKTLQLHDHHYNRKSLLNESKSRLTHATRFRRHGGVQLALDLGLPPLDRSHPRFKRGKINTKKPGDIKKKEPHKKVDIKTKSKLVESKKKKKKKKKKRKGGPKKQKKKKQDKILEAKPKTPEHKEVEIKTKPKNGTSMAKLVKSEEGECGGIIIIILLVVICCCCWKKIPKRQLKETEVTSKKKKENEYEYTRAVGQNMEKRRQLEEELIGLQNLDEEIRQEKIAEKRRKIMNNSYEWS